MKKKLKIPVKSRETATSCFARFLRVKRADGIQQKTIDTYSQHFSAIGKHLDTSKFIDEITDTDLKLMILSMQEAGLAANSIRSYTTILKSFFFWCNNEGIFACLTDVKKLVIDLEKLDYISSAGLRAFVKLQKQMDKQGEMQIVNVKKGVMEIFELGGFTDYMTIEAL